MRHMGPVNTVQGQRAVATGFHTLDALPEVSLDMLEALGHILDIVEHPVASVVFHIGQAGTLGLEPHIDVFGHKADIGLGVGGLQVHGNVDNAIVIGLVHRAIQIGRIAVVTDQLVGENRQGTVVAVRSAGGYFHPFLNGRR